ncbi:MAG: MerR family transcriptional regulator [Acidimicrobiales bacterium]
MAQGADRERPQGDESRGLSLRIGEVATRVGMTPDLIRAWERRYGVPAPTRTPGGRRRYDHGEVEMLLTLRALVDGGLTPAEAARRLTAENRSRRDGDGMVTDPVALAIVNRCLEAILRARTPGDVARALADTAEALGAVLESPEEGRSEQIPVDLSLGTADPIVAATPVLSIARMRLERVLPNLVVHARRMVDLLACGGWPDGGAGEDP